jgi:hypothetical protein
MARKKKLSRKEQKRLEKQRKAEFRERQGWVQDNEPRSSIAESILPILGDTQAESVDNMMNALWESYDLANEPEFEELLWSPFATMEHFMIASEQRGWSPEVLGRMDEEAAAEAHDEIIEAVIPKLVTHEVKGEILERLESLHGRLQKQGDAQKAAQATFVKLFLSDKKNKEGWALTGLVDALVRKSFAAGLEVVEATDFGGPDLSYEEIMAQASTTQVDSKVQSLLNRIPGLGRFLENEVDHIWDKGVDAIFNGELYLGLFEEEELDHVSELTQEYLVPAFTAKKPDKALKEAMPRYLAELESYITVLFSDPQRLPLLRQRLNEAIQEREFDAHWQPFVHMLKDVLNEEDAVEAERPFFINALMGEHRTLALMYANEDIDSEE